MFKNNAYATIWDIDKTTHKTVEVADKYAEIAITTSYKNKAQNKYETDFSARVRLYGAAFEKAKGLNFIEGDRIQLKEVGVSNKYDKIKKKMYVNYQCYDFEIAEQQDKKPGKVTIEDSPIGDLDSEELPF